MKKYAFIKDGKVHSIIEGKDDATKDWESYYGKLKGMVCKAIPEAGSVGVGFTYADGIFENPIPPVVFTKNKLKQQLREEAKKIALEEMAAAYMEAHKIDLDAVESKIDSGEIKENAGKALRDELQKTK